MSYLDDYTDFQSVYDHIQNPSLIGWSDGCDFARFRIQHPNYLSDLNKHILVLYETYENLHWRRYAQIEANADALEATSRLGFGMLMRHCLETISIDLAISNRIPLFKDVGSDKVATTVFERLDALRGRYTPFYSREKERILFDALNLTNEIAHPHIIGTGHSFADILHFYRNTFRSILESQITLSQRRHIRRYLFALQKRMDNFSLKDKITRILIIGDLVRQLTECAVNRWCFNCDIIPTDASTAENQIGLSHSLSKLSDIAKHNQDSPESAIETHTNLMTQSVISSLFSLKNASNSLMHVTSDDINLRHIRRCGKTLAHLHPELKIECSPSALEMKLNRDVQKKTTLCTTLLCGFLGWFGAHHFYAGNIAKGIFFFLTLGCCFIGPFFSLKNIIGGTFFTKRWGKLAQTGFSTFLSFVFMALHALLIYVIFFKK